MNAIQTEVSDGTLHVINVGLQYFGQNDISVYLNLGDTPLVEGTDYQWTSSTAITFLAGGVFPGGIVPAGDSIVLRRRTEDDTMLNVLDGGAPFNRFTLDENFRQLLFLAQEFTEGVGLNEIRQNLNMHDYRIVNVGDPTAPKDAANKHYIDDLIAALIEAGEGPIAAAANVSFVGANGYVGTLQDLAVAMNTLKGAFMIGLKSGGNVGQAVTYVTPAMYGAVNDGVADDYAAITAAAAYATANNVELWMGGSFAVSAGLDFSAVRKIRCFNDCTIIPTFDTGVAVKWVAASGALIEKPIQDGDMHVSWPARDWTKDRTSFLLQNIYNGRFCFSSSRATRGLLLKGLERGCVYNDIDIGVWANNLVGVWFSSGSAAGWCNANRIFGGRFYGANGVGAGQTVAGSLYETRAGHFYIETTPYACNGNALIKNSIEWVGPGFRLARMGGLSNRLEPVYGELGAGDTTWIVDTGTNNYLDLTGVPSLSTGYDPDLSGASNRVDVSLATNPQVRGTINYSAGVTVDIRRTTSATRAAVRAENAGTGPAIEGRSASSGTNPALTLTGPSGVGGVSIPPAGTWTVFNGTKKVAWSMAAAPTTGTWERGDLVFFTNPSPSGKIGAVCTASGTPGTWKSWGLIDA